jgi:hypothetical protein
VELLKWSCADISLAPEYETAATTLKSKGDIVLAKVSPFHPPFHPHSPTTPFFHLLMGIELTSKVDCTENQPLCNEYGVSGYPTLKVFRNGTPQDYAGPRKADGIISYMVK